MTEDELNSRFSPDLICTAKSYYFRLQRLILKFTPLSLRGTLDTFHPVWHLQDGLWTCRCDCNYPKNECIHTYLAAFLFKVVCQKEGWAMPKAKTLPENTPASAQTSKDSQPAVRTRIPASPARKHPPSQQLTFFDNEPPAATGNHQTQAVQPQNCSLVCEADFTENRYRVKLQFFRVKGEERYPMLLSAVRLLGTELEKTEKQNLTPTCIWSDKDKDFIKWLHLKLQDLNFRQLSIRELYLMPGDFWRWVDHWKEVPGRFIEHDSQEAVDERDIGAPSHLTVRLYDHKSFIRVALLLIMKNGKEYHYRDLRRILAEDLSGVIRNRLAEFNSPISQETLNRFFGLTSAEIPRGELCKKLPEMLEDHLELIEPCPCLQIIDGAAPDLTISSNFNGYSFYLTLKFGEKTIFPNQGIIGKDGICRTLDYLHGKFVLHQYSIGLLQELNQRMQQFINDTGGSVYQEKYLCRATLENAQRLRAFWEALPNGVTKQCDDKTRGLLDKAYGRTQLELSMHERGRLIEVSASCHCGKATIPFQTLKNAARLNNTIIQSSAGDWFDIDPDSFREAFMALAENGIDENTSLMLPDQAIHAMKRLEKIGLLQLEDRSVSFARRLSQNTIPDTPQIHDSLVAILRPYQRIGTQFLLERSRFGVGAILADDMGLGKTLEVLAMVDAWRRTASGRRFRALVVAPASVVPVWCSQSRTFCPEMRTVALVGNKVARKRILDRDEYDILVTHYGLVRNEIELLSKIQFDFVILDEAQAIKNPDAQISLAVRALEAGCRMALTGTPLENSLRDLWSIMDFLNPGLLEERERFLANYASQSGKVVIAKQLAMLMLRRTKEMVAPELPPKTEELLAVEMSPEMTKAYNQELVKARLSAESFSAVNILSAITRLRMFCCAPELVQGLSKTLASPKLELLVEQLTVLLGSGHSVLVFSQFTSMLDLIGARLNQEKIPYRVITGDVPVEKRAGIVQAFEQDANPSVFLLSLKAAGTGLTLTKADYVFLFDPWWNPAVENQAIDRTHRIGQDKPVFAYRLIVKETVEEKVLKIVESKRQLFAEVIDNVDANGNDSRLTLEELRGLLNS